MAQAGRVAEMLVALVEHYLEHPERLSDDAVFDDDKVLAAVAYVDGMTDRFACSQAISLLGWDPERLPRGQDVAWT
jgi:dGTPase